jgi:hypothetical protein
VVAGYDWFQPSDLPEFFHALQKATQPAILVGGQSLTFWVDYYKIPVPQSDTPYLTQDADVLATKKKLKAPESISFSVKPTLHQNNSTPVPFILPFIS